MAYARFVPGFSRHMKRLKCGPVSSWLWVCSVDHCTEYLTDGFLDEQAVPGLCPAINGANLKRCVDNLVALGSWEKVPGGFMVRNYLKHNLSKTQVEAERESSRHRYLNHKGRDHARIHAVTTPETTGVTTPLATPLDPHLTPVSQPLSRLVHADGSQSGSQASSKPTTSKGPVALATEPNGRPADRPTPTEAEMAEHHARQDKARSMLRTIPADPPKETTP